MSKTALVTRAKALGLKCPEGFAFSSSDDIRTLVKDGVLLDGKVTYKDLEPTLMDDFETMSGPSLKKLAKRYWVPIEHTGPKCRVLRALKERRSQMLASYGASSLSGVDTMSSLRAEVKKRMIERYSIMSRRELTEIIHLGADNRNLESVMGKQSF